MIYLASVFMCVGVLFGNLAALAMEPLGHIAGVGAAVVASLASLISVPLGILIGQQLDGTMYALIAAFALFGAATHVASPRARAAREGPLAPTPARASFADARGRSLLVSDQVRATTRGRGVPEAFFRREIACASSKRSRRYAVCS